MPFQANDVLLGEDLVTPFELCVLHVPWALVLGVRGVVPWSAASAMWAFRDGSEGLGGGFNGTMPSATRSTRSLFVPTIG
jgi:hypothetical protein